jgi:glycosyltransferase involved in cell wall biosynthesis
LAEAMKALRLAIAPTAFLKTAYEANGFPAPLLLSHFGVDIDRSAKPARPRGKLRLGYIGQLAPHKGADILLAALRALPPTDVALTLYGSLEQDPIYTARLRALAAGHDVDFGGVIPKERLAATFGGFDALIVPSIWPENGPLVLLQSLATHTPVIVSDVPGLTEFVREGENGFVFPKGDDEALARLLRRLSGATNELVEMSGRTSYERTAREMGREILDLYDAALATPDHGLAGTVPTGS